MAAEEFAPQGIYAAMITPFNEDGRVDLEQVSQIINFLIEKKVDGIFPVSNVGEFLSLTLEEKRGFCGQSPNIAGYYLQH